MSAPEFLTTQDFDAACGSVMTAQLDAFDDAVAVGAEYVATGRLDAAEVAERLVNVATAVGLVESYGLHEVQQAIAAVFTEARATAPRCETAEAAA
jgi:hypothetical protein